MLKKGSFMQFSEKIKFIRTTLKLKQKEFAEKLNTSDAAISRYEKEEREPSALFIEKLINVFEINPMWIYNKSEVIFLENDSCFKAQTLAIENQIQDELKLILQNFIDSKTVMSVLKEKIQRIKGQTFMEKLLASLNGDAERMLILLYAFLNHLKKANLQTSEDINAKFTVALKEFPFSKINGLKYGVILKDRDFENLQNFANEELDNVSIGEIIMVLEDLKSFIKDRLVLKVDDVTIKSLEKIFS